jgi:hypothetical protein
VAGVGDQRGDGLAAVYGAAAAKADNQIAAFFTRKPDTLKNPVDGRLPADRKRRAADLVLVEDGEQSRGPFGIPAADDQCAPSQLGGERPTPSNVPAPKTIRVAVANSKHRHSPMDFEV